MRKVRCYECGKTYDYDTDDFCPKCGAFNQPPKSTTIDANGAVIRVDGINERGHAGSFVHEELHEENRERKRMGLSKGTRRTAAAAPQPSVQRTASRQSGRQSGESAACGGQADLLDFCGHHRAEYPQFFSRTFADVVTGFHPFG